MAAAAVATPSPTPRPHPTAARRDRHALLIGIDSAQGSRPLAGAVTDAEILQEALEIHGFAQDNVEMLLDAEATAAGILAALDALADRVPRNGLAVFAFAGHTRIDGGVNHFVAADGQLVDAGAVASRLGRVQAPMWVALPTCYAGGYSLPGIVGPGRVATFASASDQVSYELGAAGSHLIIHMVQRQLLATGPASSVEDAFARARRSLLRERPDRVPHIEDGYPGDLVLGDREIDRVEALEEPAQAPTPAPTLQPPTPSPDTGGGDGGYTLRVCGRYRLNCRP